MAVLALPPLVTVPEIFALPEVAVAVQTTIQAVRYAPPPIKVGAVGLLAGLLVYEVIVHLPRVDKNTDWGLQNGKASTRLIPPPGVVAQATGKVSKIYPGAVKLTLTVTAQSTSTIDSGYYPTFDCDKSIAAQITQPFTYESGGFELRQANPGTALGLSWMTLNDGCPNRPGYEHKPFGLQVTEYFPNGSTSPVGSVYPVPTWNGPNNDRQAWNYPPLSTYDLTVQPSQFDPLATAPPLLGSPLPGVAGVQVQAGSGYAIPHPKTDVIAPPVVKDRTGTTQVTGTSVVTTGPGTAAKSTDVPVVYSPTVITVPVGARDVTDGKVKDIPVPPVPVTDPTTHITPLGPVTANPPRADIIAIAQEMSRQEQKLNALQAVPPPDFGFVQLIEELLQAILNTYDYGDYILRGVCQPDQSGNEPFRRFPYGGSVNAFTNISTRLDAIADMLQYSKELKQPTCSPTPPPIQLTGEPVTIHFVSTENSPSGDKPLRKVFRYRDQTAAPLINHVNHWADYSWQAGPVIVVSTGLSWGQVKVWAASIGEGKAVIQHAAAIAGVDLNAKDHKWIISSSPDLRYGQQGTMVVQRFKRDGGYYISKRPGPDGPAEYVFPT